MLPRSSSKAFSTRGSATFPSKSMKNRYSNRAPLRGRDSSFVMLIACRSNTISALSSAPASWAVATINDVRAGMRGSTVTGWGATTMNRVRFSG